MRSSLRIHAAEMFLIIAFSWFATFASSAANDTIQGTVIDSATCALIDSATVQSEGVSITTKASGTFTLIFSKTNVLPAAKKEKTLAITWSISRGVFSWPGYSRDISIRIQNVYGREVASYSSAKNATGSGFFIGNLPQGMYIARIKTMDRYDVIKLPCIITAAGFSSHTLRFSTSVSVHLAETGSSHFVTFSKSGYVKKTIVVTAGASSNSDIQVQLAASARILNMLVITNSDLPGWKMAPDSFAYYNSVNIYSDIGGGAEEYIDNGMTVALDMHMVFADGIETLGPHCFVMDFQNDSNATAMYYHKKKQYAAKQAAFPIEFDTSVAFIYTGMPDSVIAFAHFNRFYLEFPFKGYTDQDQAIANAAQFLEIEQSIINILTSSKPIELIYPKGGCGQSFKVSDTVRIRWSIHDRNQISSVEIGYSLNGGATWSSAPMVNASFLYPDTIYLWTIGSSQVSTQFILKINDYINHSIQDQSAPFAISK